MKILESIKEVVIKFLSKALMKHELPIREKGEAAAVLCRIGERQIAIIRSEADLAAQILALQEKVGEEFRPVRDQIEIDMTRLRDFGKESGLLEGDSQTLDLSTGRISFYYGPQRASVKDETEVVAMLKALPEDHPLRQLLEFPPPPEPKLNKGKLVSQREIIPDLEAVIGPGKISFKKTLFFAAFPTAQPELKESLKISGKVKDVPVP